MIVCKQCGVELDDGMEVCPLCEISAANDLETKMDIDNRNPVDQHNYPPLLKRILWQVASVLLLSGIIATLVIDVSIDGHMTWSIYPATICLIMLSYALVAALFNIRFQNQIVIGWIVSAGLLVGVQAYSTAEWPVQLALPILCAVNAIILVIVLIFRNARVRGLNILAIVFIAFAVLCLSIEIIVSLHFQKNVVVRWSVIVAACLLPATAAILFMHFRTRNNSDLQKLFHS